MTKNKIVKKWRGTRDSYNIIKKCPELLVVQPFMWYNNLVIIPHIRRKVNRRYDIINIPNININIPPIKCAYFESLLLTALILKVKMATVKIIISSEKSLLLSVIVLDTVKELQVKVVISFSKL